MIISHDGEFLIGTPTKCGTHTLEAVAKRAERRGLGSQLCIAGPIAPDTSRRQHHMYVPKEWAHYRRLLLVRNPYDRAVSLYEWLRDPAWYTQWGAKYVQRGEHPKVDGDSRPAMNFNEFVTWLREQKRDWVNVESRALSEGRVVRGEGSMAYQSPWIFIDGLVQSYQHLFDTIHVNSWSSAGDFIRIEHVHEDLASLFATQEVPVLIDLLDGKLHNNATRGRGGRPWQSYFYSKRGNPRGAIHVVNDLWASRDCKMLGLAELGEDYPLLDPNSKRED